MQALVVIFFFVGNMFSLKFSKITRDVQWSFISLATSSFAHLLLRIALGKELGPSGLGLYTLIFTIYMFGMQFAGFGIGPAMTKYISEFRDDLHKIGEFVSSGILGSIISGSVIGLLLYVFSETISIQLFHSDEMIDLLKLTAFCFPFIAVQKAVLGILNGLRNMKWFAIVNIIQNISVVIVSITLVTQLSMNVRGAVIGFVLPTILVGLLSLILIKDHFTAEISTLRMAFKEISYFGFYVLLTNSIGLINTQIDSLMIGHFINETEVGYYAIAVLLIEGLSLIPSSIETVTDTRIVYFYVRKDYANLIRLLRSNVLKVFVITVIESLGLLFFGRFLIEKIFGIDYLPAYTPLLILLVGYSLYYPTLSINGFLPGVGKVALLSKISFICALMNIFLNILLVPYYGIIGAALATSIALIFSTFVRHYFTIKYMPRTS